MTTRIDRVIRTLQTLDHPIPRVNVPLLIKSLEELRDMIGLEEIKTTIVRQVLHSLFFADNPDPEVLYNVMIIGPPGVGKTLLIQNLARIWSAVQLVPKKEENTLFEQSHHMNWWLKFVGDQIEQINDELGEAGYSSPEVNVNVHQRLNWMHEVCTKLGTRKEIETKRVHVGNGPKICYIRRDMAIGTHQGETSKWTYDLLEQSKGGVIVLDEFYSMINGDDGNDEFGRECVNTINQFITDHPETRFIIAGYEENIKKSIFRFQPGMESRFPWVFKIEGYKPSELTEMFLKRFNLKCAVNVTREWIQELIKDNETVFSSYGRSIVQFSFRISVIVADRAFDNQTTREETIVTRHDFLEALKELLKMHPKKENLPMYN